MQNTSLARILTSMDKNELKEFEKFVNTPFFIGRKKAIELFKILKKHHPDFNSPKLEKHTLFEKLYPGEEYNDTLMRKLISELYKSVERYFAYLNFMKDDFAFNHHLISEINIRGLDKETGINIREAFKDLNNRPERNSDYYNKKNLLLEQEGWLLSNDFPKLYVNVQQAYEAYCNFFLITVLSYYLRVLNDNIYRDSGFKLDFMEELFLMLDDSKYLKIPAIAVNYYAIKSYRDIDDDESLYKFRDLLYKHGKQIGSEAEWVLHSILVTCCVARSDLGKEEFLNEAHEVQKRQLKKGFCYARGFFLPMFFDYICMIALDLGNITFVEKFIEKYKDDLPPAEKDNVLNYNYARLAQYKGEHEKALDLISKMGYRDLPRGTSIRILSMQIYYDLDMIDPCMHLIDSFRHYLDGNKKLGQDVKDRAKRMLNIVQRLLKIKAGSSRISILDVKKKAKEKEEIMKRYWIMDRITQLEKLL